MLRKLGFGVSITTAQPQDSPGRNVGGEELDVSNVDTEEIEHYAEITEKFVNDLLERLINQGLLVSAAKGKADDKAVKRINALQTNIENRKADFGCVDGTFVDAALVEKASGNKTYLPLVYKLNLAEIAYQLFRIQPSTDTARIALQAIKEAFPECLGLAKDVYNAQFIILVAIQSYILTLAEPRFPRKISDPLKDFNSLLDDVPIDTESDIKRVDDARRILGSTKEKKSLIDALRREFPWTEFIEHASAWISVTIAILDKRQFPPGLAMVAGVEMVATEIDASAPRRSTRKGKGPKSAETSMSATITRQTRLKRRQEEPESRIIEESKRKKYNERQKYAEKVSFSQDSSQSRPEAGNFTITVQSASPPSERPKRSVKSGPPAPSDEDLYEGAEAKGSDKDEAESSVSTRRATPAQISQSQALKAKNLSPTKSWEHPRRKWSPEMEDALLKAIQKYERWTAIEKKVMQAVEESKAGRPLNADLFEELVLLEGLNQMNLKDKARNIKHNMILQGKLIPLFLRPITVSKRIVGDRTPLYDE
ncbi:hypothetical protein POJ06DRAFT_117247 [Lipomyces tetrasporus]|uniref:Uncharacterized protein n=1 Tax=Lipomyces tetrasporus TaxID=54092 RepID=A0AAD7QRW3_9ASCO|nr:uncharacterized protein POJ06DRAFT_117247 [Lipomyces tetrasporus]KAJ8099816.1 hypothetical protein POJ06DRAFT_117247 [Lipomyces tetrasporus]